ncbi:hypothetical protein [Thiolapillus sp.]
MKDKMTKLAMGISLMGSGAVFAHAGEHASIGVLQALTHFLVEHGYLAVALACGIGVACLLRFRRV